MKITNKQPTHFSDIVIIYNPKSTGPGKAMAQKLQHALKEAVPGQKVSVIETKHAGHAEKIARTVATSSARPLIISASGDGGYHEVVNGIVQAQDEAAHPVAGVLPAGNANDHFHDVHGSDIVASIQKHDLQQIDLLKLTTTVKGKPFVRYAHSYIGFGLTPIVGKTLKNSDARWYNEGVVVMKALLSLHSIKILLDGKQQRYYSVICSNVSKMSKVLIIAKDASHNDGKYEVTLFKRHNKFQLIKTLLRVSTRGLSGKSRKSDFAFKTIKPLLVQLDGEICTIDGDTQVTVSLEPRKLTCIV